MAKHHCFPDVEPYGICLPTEDYMIYKYIQCMAKHDCFTDVEPGLSDVDTTENKHFSNSDCEIPGCIFCVTRSYFPITIR